MAETNRWGHAPLTTEETKYMQACSRELLRERQIQVGMLPETTLKRNMKMDEKNRDSENIAARNDQKREGMADCDQKTVGATSCDQKKERPDCCDQKKEGSDSCDQNKKEDASFEQNKCELTDFAQKIYDDFRGRASKDDEFNDWANYRSRLTDFVIRNAKPGSSLIIFGAGKCNDLDLNKLVGHFGKVTLSDYRPETAEEALARYGLSWSDDLQFLEADYAGISNQDYIDYICSLIPVLLKGSCSGEMIAPAGAPGDVADDPLVHLQQTLKRIFEKNKSYMIDLSDSQNDDKYDYGIIAGVHSQLNNSFRGILEYTQKELSELSDDAARPLGIEQLSGKNKPSVSAQPGGGALPGGNAHSKGTDQSGDSAQPGERYLPTGSAPYIEHVRLAIADITKSHTGDFVRRFNAAAFEIVRGGIVYGYEESIIITSGSSRVDQRAASWFMQQSADNASAPAYQIATVDGARQAGEEVRNYQIADQMSCIWPLSYKRGIRFEMSIFFLTKK